MGIRYVGGNPSYIARRTKHNNVDRWMHIPEPKHKPRLEDVLWETVCIIAAAIIIAFFVIWFVTG